MSAKSRLSVYLEPTLLRALERFALEHRKSKSLVAEAAISAGSSMRRGAASPDSRDQKAGSWS